jgi:hypothetical protein
MEQFALFYIQEIEAMYTSINSVLRSFGIGSRRQMVSATTDALSYTSAVHNALLTAVDDIATQHYLNSQEASLCYEIAQQYAGVKKVDWKAVAATFHNNRLSFTRDCAESITLMMKEIVLHNI